jgi:hypothetical protein
MSVYFAGESEVERIRRQQGAGDGAFTALLHRVIAGQRGYGPPLAPAGPERVDNEFAPGPVASPANVGVMKDVRRMLAEVYGKK